MTATVLLVQWTFTLLKKMEVTSPYQPYFYIATKKDTEREVSAFLSKIQSGRLAGIDMVHREDLDNV